MSHELRSNLAQMARMGAAAFASPRIGTVTSAGGATGPAGYVKVEVQPEGVETGWIPVLTAWLGSGWGLCAVPPQGAQVLVAFQEGDLDAGLVLGLVPNDTDTPQAGVAGEFWLVHQSGSFIKLLNDGTIASHGTWNHDGVLNVQGDVHSTGTVTGDTDVVGGGKHLKTHIHTGVQTGGGTSGPPQ